MEMEMVELDGTGLAERLIAAATRLEAAAEKLATQEIALQATSALEERLREAEATIAALRAAGAGARKTIAAGAMVSKEGGNALEAGALDAALGSLSLEQRIAVKAGLLRSGLVG